MAQELSHRGDELKGLGWNGPDVARYIELWEYRQRWGLPSDYPMVAPNYAAQRSKLAKEIGLGTRRSSD